MSTTTNAYPPDDGPPFPLPAALLGGTATPLPDTPLTIIFLLLFTGALLLALFVHHLDRVRTLTTHAPAPQPSHHLLHLLPCLRTTFTLTRLPALATRLAWAYDPTNLSLEIASAILAPAGVVLLLVANLLMARRFVRDYAVAGTHPAVVRVTRFLLFCAVVSLVMGVSVHADAYFTEDAEALHECRVIWLVAACIRVALAVVPVVAVGFVGWKWRDEGEVEGQRGRFKGRMVLICFVGLLLTLEEGFLTGVAFEGRPVGSTAWFLSKACYYCFGFMLETFIMYSFLAARLDKRFRLRPREPEKREGEEFGARRGWYERLMDRLNTEMEVFGHSG